MAEQELDDQKRGNRFAHLLKPIRDLAANWNIDIATELEEYLGELESIVISFDDGETNFNFAEAALLIQGSACVYSKKVEYLYGLLYKTLDVLIQKKTKDKKQESSVGTDGVDADTLGFDDEPMLIPLDDLLKESKNIDLPERANADYTKDRASNLVARVPTTLLATTQNVGEGGETSESFALSNCLVHESGALLLDAREAMYLDQSLKYARGKAEHSYGSPAAFLQNLDVKVDLRAEQQESPPVRNMESLDVASAPELDLNIMDIGDQGDEMDTKHRHAASPTEPRLTSVLGESQDQQSLEGGWEQEDEEEPDPYQLADPHTNTGPKSRAFRKGRTFTLPRAEKTPPTSAQYVEMLAHSRHPLFETITECIDKKSVKTPYFAEFIYIFLNETSNRRSLRRNEKKLAMQSGAKKNPVLVPDGPPMADLQRDSDDEEADMAGDNSGSLDFIDQGSLDLDSNQWGDREPGADLKEAAELFKDYQETELAVEFSQESSLDATTYDELCRRHVDAYMKSSEAFLTETKLMKRVSQWEERLLPILKREEERVVFDIDLYGNRLLSHLQQLSLQENPAAPQDTVHSFDRVVAGKEKFEISRIFLATLQMSNENNLKIVPTDRKAVESGESIQEFSLKLVNVQRIRAMETFMAPSARMRAERMIQPAKLLSSAPPENSNTRNKDEKDHHKSGVSLSSTDLQSSTVKHTKASRRRDRTALKTTQSESQQPEVQKEQKSPLTKKLRISANQKQLAKRRSVHFSDAIQVNTFELEADTLEDESESDE
eukprot:gb/GEZN01001920.1/.p1 GENE.gb/GEZN01001920.1/~~gb/GEZN01001920.1/.p1  ORF type:complete len:787 (-),score=115.36 gb/GEZN01001920.1/:386-2716(-)